MISKPVVPQDPSQWHRWFAWRPVKVTAGNSTMYVRVWWQWIERKFTYSYDDHTAHYRLIK